ncbi:MAG: hypothetical protein HC804_01345 [Anaerolineae bacterium]|nr:hypothetical protein [Anaerolineae bacterium]
MTFSERSSSFVSPRAEIVLLVIVLVITAVTRMGWPGLTEFKADEARLLELALQMADFERFPVRGISSSVGLPNFPMSVWLYALPLFLWKSVLAATLFTGLLNALAVLACYWLVRRYWGVEAALTAALLFAVSPWAIHHSRKIWAQNLLPFFVVGWGITAMLTFVESRSRWIIAHLLCLAIAAQAHLAALALIPATAVFMAVFWRRLNWKYTLLGLGLAGLTFVPFAYYLLSSGQGYGNVVTAVTGSVSAARGWPLAPLLHAWRLISGWQIHALAGTAFADFLDTAPNLTLVYWLWAALFTAGLIYITWYMWHTRHHHNKYTELYFVLLVWLLAPLVVFLLPVLPVELHYLLPIYPVPYMVMGIFVAWLAARWRRVAPLLLVVLLLTAVAQLWVMGNLQLFLSQTATPGGFGTPLARQLTAVDQARRLITETGAAEVIIAGAGDAPALDEFAAVYGVLLRDVPHRFVRVTATAVFPAHNSVILLNTMAGGLGHLYVAAADTAVTVPLRQGEGVLQILTVGETAVPAAAHVIDPPAILTNWASFAGYSDPVFNKDGTANWQVFWNSGEAAALDYHLFVHVLDGEGTRVGQMDTAVFPASQWQPGDVVISQFRMEWPDDVTRLRTGMYVYPSLEPVLLFDLAGHPAADALEIPLQTQLP